MKAYERMTPDELADLLDKAEMIESWVKGVRATVQELIESGTAVPRWKLIPKRGMRRWANVDLAKERLKTEGILRDLCADQLASPTQVERYLKKKGLQISITDLITTESSGVNLVREDDQRIAVGVGAAQKDFTEFTG